VAVSERIELARTNARLAFDREAAHGFRLDIPAGSSVRFAPSETKDVALVRYRDRDGADG